MYSIEFTKQATKDLAKIPKDYSLLIIEKIKKLSFNPYSRKLNVKQLKGLDAFRLIVGDYRIIYDIIKKKLLINIIKIQVRGSVYD